jgi:anti-sigma factor RsiW
VIQAADEHLASCAECRRYMHVIERGLELLHALPAPEVRDDFVPRLQHRIYHVDQERSLRWHTSSGTTALAMAGMAILLTAVAWSPVLRSSAPTVELEPIVVSRTLPVAAEDGLPHGAPGDAAGAGRLLRRALG